MYRHRCIYSKSGKISQGTFESSLNSTCASILSELMSNQVSVKDDSFVSSSTWDKLCVAIFNGKVKLPTLKHLMNGKSFDFPQSLTSMNAVEVINAFSAQWCWSSLKYAPSLQRHFHCQTICCAQLYHLLKDDSSKQMLQWITLNLVTGTLNLVGVSMCNYQRIFYRSLSSCIRLFQWLRKQFEFESMVHQLAAFDSNGGGASNSNFKLSMQDLAKFIVNTRNVGDCTIKKWFLFVSSLEKLTPAEMKELDASLIEKTNIYSLNEKVLKKLFPDENGEEKREISSAQFGNYKWSVAPVVNVLSRFSKHLQKWFTHLKQVCAREIKDQCTNDQTKNLIDIIMNEDDDCKSCCDSIDSLSSSNSFEHVKDKCTLNMFKWLIFKDKDMDDDDEVDEPKLSVDDLIQLFTRFETCRLNFKWSNTWTRYGSQYKSVADCTNLLGYVHGWYYFLAELTHFTPVFESSITIRNNGTANILKSNFVFGMVRVSDELVTAAWTKWRTLNNGFLGSMALTNIMVYFGEFERRFAASQLVCTQLDKQSLQDTQAEQFVADSLALDMSPNRENLKNHNHNYKKHKQAIENINKSGSTNLKAWNEKRQIAMKKLNAFELKPHYGYKLGDFLGLQLIQCDTSVGEWWKDQIVLQKDYTNWHAIHSNKYQNTLKNSLGMEAYVLTAHGAHTSGVGKMRKHGQPPGDDNQSNIQEIMNQANDDGEAEEDENENDDDDMQCGHGGSIKECGDWNKLKSLNNNWVDVIDNILGFVVDNMKCHSIIFNSNGKFGKVTKCIGQVKKLNDGSIVDWKAELKSSFKKKCAADMIDTLQKMIHQIKLVKNSKEKFIFIGCNFITIVGELIVLPQTSGPKYVQCS